MDRAHRSQVLERHLRWPVLPDLDPGMGAHQPDVGLRDGGHADEVIRAREERSEGGGERPVAPNAHTDCARHQLLLGDVDLEEPLRVGLGELVGVGRVRDLAVHRDHVGDRSQRQECVPVGLARGHLVLFLVGGQAHRRQRPRAVLALDGRGSGFGFARLDLQMADPAELLDRPFGHVRRQRLAVPAVLVLDLGEAFALDRLGDDHGRLSRVRERTAEGPVDGGDVMAVDDDRDASESLCPAPVGVGAPAVLGRALVSDDAVRRCGIARESGTALFDRRSICSNRPNFWYARAFRIVNRQFAFAQALRKFPGAVW